MGWKREAEAWKFFLPDLTTNNTRGFTGVRDYLL